ncbi:tryptophan 7-halogenase [Sphingomonas bacterium]|uniref:tryptophan 7-halogenase n=1 Tax=Sphingomonas bacterium TaxID=1895847 RepID=UPI00261D0F96|nr:tryptophan 7-halogenase [Sphingomonas bacterium]MDB5679331.1 tryptophan halogenase [Sphingomonas bacterium]
MKHVVILGRDAPLWLSASVLQASLRPAGVEVTAIELPTKLYPSDVYATLPGIEALHARLGLDERDLLRGTRGAYSLGQNFVDMLGGTPAFLNAYGGYGAPIDDRDFFGYWVKARDAGLPAEFEAFSLTAAAARQGRVMIPDEASEAYGRADYGYHLPAIAYAGGLKSVATRLGVDVVAANHIVVDRDASGAITALVADGHAIAGDLFVDATGDDAALIGVTLGVAQDSWRSWFPVDRVFTACGPAFDSIPTYAELRAWHGGWTALYPGQAATHVVHAFASGQTSDEDALRGAGAASGLTLSDAVLRPSNPGCRAQIWAHNCVAIGAAACALDPVHNLDLHAVQLGLIALLSNFPAGADAAPSGAEYNRIMRSSFERLRDYQAAIYALAPYPGLFWHAGREAAPQPTLAHIIATFRARGELPPMEEDSIPFDHWRALLTGLGVVPESWPPRIDATDDAEIAAQFRRMLGFVKETVSRQPTHSQALGHG